MALVGHESAAMSARYTHVGKEALAKAGPDASRNQSEKMNPPKLPHSIYSQTESPTKDDIEFESLVGQMVFILQDTEQGIRFCDQIVFNPQEAHVTTEFSGAIGGGLAEIIENLRKRTSLDDDFEQMLEALWGLKEKSPRSQINRGGRPRMKEQFKGCL